MSWKNIQVKDLGEIITGNTPPRKNPEYYGDYTLFVKPTDMDIDTKYTYTTEEYYSKLGYEKYKKSLIPKGSTCVVTIGSIGKKMTKAHCDLFVNQAVNAIVPNKNYDEDFVYYLLKFNLAQVKVLDSGTASGRENVSKSSFSKISLTVPSLKVQKKIGNILSNYDNLIENNNKRIKLFEQSTEEIYKEWFVRFRFPNYQNTKIVDGMPEGWEEKELSTIMSFINGYAFKSSDFTEVGNSIVKIKNIDNNSIDLENIDRVDQSITQKLNHKFEVRESDLLIAMTGATVGKLGLMPKPIEKTFMNQRVGKIVSIYKYFIYQELKSLKGQQNIVNLADGAAQPNISSSQILGIKCLIPTENILDSFEKVVQSFYDEILTLQAKNQNLKQTRDLLLPRLISGKLNIEDLDIK